VKEWPEGVSASLMGAAYSTNSWSRHRASLNSWNEFAIHTGTTSSWPFKIESLRGYVGWAITVKRLQPSTVKVYMSDLKLAHSLRNHSTEKFDDFFIKKMLTGADHLNMYEKIKKQAKLVMTFQMLKILGHKISEANWTIEKKRLFWTASTLAFFGSFRMGEILGTDKKGKVEELKWSDVNFRKDGSILINIRFPKVIKNKNGDFADIFPIQGKNYCPVSCLTSLAKHKISNDAKNSNVFSYANGDCLTVSDFTADLKKLLKVVIGPAVANLSGHSFRAGIPAALSNHPEIASEEDVLCWGRWNSEAYKAYTKLKMSARKTIFQKILRAIM
jgi:hypothetical protein